jgi:hypothetical protein
MKDNSKKILKMEKVLSIIKTEIVLKESLKKELKKMEFINRF